MNISVILAIFQVLSGPGWLVAPIVDETDRKHFHNRRGFFWTAPIQKSVKTHKIPASLQPPVLPWLSWGEPGDAMASPQPAPTYSPCTWPSELYKWRLVHLR